MVHKADRTVRLQNAKLWPPRGVDALYQYIYTYIYICVYAPRSSDGPQNRPHCAAAKSQTLAATRGRSTVPICKNKYTHIYIYVYTHRGCKMVHKADGAARLQNVKLWPPRGIDALYQYVKINIYTYIYIYIYICTEVVRWSTKQIALRGCKIPNFGRHAGSTHCTTHRGTLKQSSMSRHASKLRRSSCRGTAVG